MGDAKTGTEINMGLLSNGSVQRSAGTDVDQSPCCPQSPPMAMLMSRLSRGRDCEGHQQVLKILPELARCPLDHEHSAARGSGGEGFCCSRALPLSTAVTQMPQERLCRGTRRPWGLQWPGFLGGIGCFATGDGRWRYIAMAGETVRKPPRLSLHGKRGTTRWLEQMKHSRTFGHVNLSSRRIRDPPDVGFSK